MTEKPSDSNDGSNREIAVLGAIFVLVLAVFYQTVGFDFITLDDNLYVYSNPAVMAGLNWESIKWAFTAFHSANWHPLTWMSHMLDVKLFGTSAGGHHAMNVMIHLVNSLLTLVVFRKLTNRFWPSAAIALLFAVHPTHVESVAWISERKDVLSTMLMLLAIWAYAEFARSDDAESDGKFWNSRAYIAALALFAAGLMAKPMLVTLPFVLLLFDYWPLRRFDDLGGLKRLLIEKLPFFALTVVSSVITLMAQRSAGAISPLSYLPIETRLMNTVVSYVKYIAMLFYPADLGIWYPYPESIPIWQAAAAVVLLAAITFVCYKLRDAHRYLLSGWLIFLGTLVPVIGIVQVGGQAMADRYTYVPYFGLFIMLAFGIDALFGEAKRKAFIGIFAAAVLALAGLSYVQAGYWKNSETIYKRTLAVTSGNYMAAGNLCLYFATNDRAAEAEPLCREAIAANPEFPLAYNSLGIALMKQQRYIDAEAAFKDYVARSPRDVIGYANLATAQIIQGRPEDAEPNLKIASELNDGSMTRETFGSAVGDLAKAYALRGNYEKAVESYTRQINLFPDVPQLRFRLANALYEAKRYDEARQQADLAAQMAPNDADTANLSGKLLMQAGKSAEAEAEFKRALGINPEHSEAKSNLQKARGEK